MKIALMLLLLLNCTAPIFAQKTKKIVQKELGIKYSLPKDWMVDAFGGVGWEEAGSGVCTCSGTINTGNLMEENEIIMVVYPTLFKDSLSSFKRKKLWDMEFDNNGVVSEIKTEKLVFEKVISTFKALNNKGYEDKEVWQLKTQSNGQYYVLYFWAKRETMPDLEPTILKILESFEAVVSKPELEYKY